MSTILEKIVARKKEDISRKQVSITLNTLEKNLHLNASCFSLKKALEEKTGIGIIAEFKRRSPSKGIINKYADVIQTTSGYIKSGASALSILTDEYFFGGSMDDFKKARKANNCPILRKDFIISEYEIMESKSIGADVILLIAAILKPEETLKLASLAKDLGMEVLLEIHKKEELDRINEFVDVVGVNNRNLNDFSVSIDRSLELYDLIPSSFPKISESGINSPETLITLKEKGFNGFLIGEKFMAAEHPEKAFADFINELNQAEKKHEIKN